MPPTEVDIWGYTQSEQVSKEIALAARKTFWFASINDDLKGYGGTINSKQGTNAVRLLASLRSGLIDYDFAG